MPRAPRLCMPFEQWPERDRAAWIRGCTPADPYDDEGASYYGARLRACSLAKARQGYGRWLHFLDAQGVLASTAPPIERITCRQLAAYFQHLKQVDNADYTIIGRFQELETAMKIMTPGHDTSWIRKPGGATIYSLLPKVKRHLLIPDSGVLFRWGLEMMDRATPESPVRDTWLTTYRDGLLIAMLAARGRRRRSMHLLRVGKELVWTGEHYRIELTPDQTKTGRADRFNLPDQLAPYIRRYLDEIRPALLKDTWYDELWISRLGTPLTVAGLETRMFRLTVKRFGEGFGPHRFRHAIATTLTLCKPDNPGLSAAVLAISPAVNGEHYVRAGQIEASLEYAQIVKERKERTSRVVRRIW